MRFAIFDYAGHPFQAELSRELARRGHETAHFFSSDIQTPKGRLSLQPGDAATLSFHPLTLGVPFQKYSFVKRQMQERQFGRIAAAAIGAWKPDVILAGNAPLDVQDAVLNMARSEGAGFVFWLQDIYSEAMSVILTRKLGVLGAAVGAYYTRLENTLLRRSDRVVAISADFVPHVERRGVPAGRIDVIENWASLDELAYMAPAPAEGRRARFIYSGTLGHKHNPDYILALARDLDVDVIVHSEGPVADELAAEAAAKGIANLKVGGWVPYDVLAATLGSADVLIAMIEKEAGVFSVPSKVLTSLCVGRAILGSIPKENLAARLITREGAGLVSEPGDPAGFVANARRLMDDRALTAQMGRAGRAYAEKTFAITAIGDRFEAVLRAAGEARTARRAS